MTKEVKTIADVANATAIDLGPLAEVKDMCWNSAPA